MATDKYLNLVGLEEVASKVNQKLRTVTVMPAAPEKNDVVLYNGATSASYKQGSIYLYTKVDEYYAWSDLSDTYYTKAESPEIGDTVYSDTQGTDSGYTIEAFDSLNNQVTLNSTVYDRDTTGDTEILDWVCKSGTSIILNGTDKTGEEANFYAPTEPGTEGQALFSNGEGVAPSWGSLSGYSPSFVDDTLVFAYGVLPEVDNTSLIFNL